MQSLFTHVSYLIWKHNKLNITYLKRQSLCRHWLIEITNTKTTDTNADFRKEIHIYLYKIIICVHNSVLNVLVIGYDTVGPDKNYIYIYNLLGCFSYLLKQFNNSPKHKYNIWKLECMTLVFLIQITSTEHILKIEISLQQNSYKLNLNRIEINRIEASQIESK